MINNRIENEQSVGVSETSLNIPESYNIKVELPNSLSIIDGILDPDGFVYCIGNQSFHFVPRNNPHLIDDIKSSEMIDKDTKEAVVAVLNFMNHNYQGTRKVFCKNMARSRYCKVCLATDYCCGLDGPTNLSEASSIFKNDVFNLVQPIKDKKLKAQALFNYAKINQDHKERCYELAAKLDETNAVYAFAYASLLSKSALSSEKRKTALPYLERAVRLDGDNADYAYEYASALSILDNEIAAFSFFEKAAKIGNVAKYAYKYASLLSAKKKDQEALTYYKKAAEHLDDGSFVFASDAADCAYKYASLLSGKNNNEAAFNYYEKAAKLDADNPQYAFKYARLLLNRDKEKEALPYLEKVAKSDKNNADYAFTYALVLYHQMGDFDAAFSYIERAAKLNTNNADYAFLYASALDDKGEEEEALNYYERAAKLDTNNAEYAYQYAYALQYTDFNTTAALPYYERALMLDKHNAEYNFMLGCALYTEGDLDNAITFLTEALALDEDHANYRYMCAEALNDAGSLYLAMVCYEGAADLEKEDGNYSYRYASLLFENGEEEKAVKYYKKAVKLDSNNPQYAYDCGIALFEIDEVSESLDYLMKASDLNVENSEYAGRCGDILLQRGEKQLASWYYGRAADHEGTNEYICSYKYACLLFELGSRTEALPFFEKSANLGNDDAKFMTGLSYALGFHKTNDGDSIGLGHYEETKETALKWLNACTNPERYAYISYVYDQELIWSIKDYYELLKEVNIHLVGADFNYAICQIRLIKLYKDLGSLCRNKGEDDQALSWFNKALSLSIQCNILGKWPEILSWYYSKHYSLNWSSYLKEIQEEINYYMRLIKEKKEQNKKSGFFGSLFK